MYNVNVLNRHKDKIPGNSIYIGRGSIFGNPYTHMNLDETKAEFRCDTRELAIESYKNWFMKQLMTDEKFGIAVGELIKKYQNEGFLNLACYCKPESCHGDYIKQFIIHYLENVY